jgi:hypothetical protein
VPKGEIYPSSVNIALLVGGVPFDRLDDTSSATPATTVYDIILVTKDATKFATLKDSEGNDVTGYYNDELNDGDTLYGGFTEISLTSGAIQAFSASK